MGSHAHEGKAQLGACTHFSGIVQLGQEHTRRAWGVWHWIASSHRTSCRLWRLTVTVSPRLHHSLYVFLKLVIVSSFLPLWISTCCCPLWKAHSPTRSTSPHCSHGPEKTVCPLFRRSNICFPWILHYTLMSVALGEKVPYILKRVLGLTQQNKTHPLHWGFSSINYHWCLLLSDTSFTK